ncbi:NADH:ubiquinone reductase (Na(+)-transporting) subunit C [Calditrichota bacterium]
MHKNSYTLFFAAMVTVTCSVLLSSAANLLKDRQQENIALDQRKNIIECAGFKAEEGKQFSRSEILDIYDNYIKSTVLDLNGNTFEDKKAADLNPKKDNDLLPLYYAEEDGKLSSYIIPISGKGLWSTIYGYLALEPDGNTVKGITFYQHGETPGLGGEIEKEWFTNNFQGKQIRSPDGSLVSITIIKGKVEEKISEQDKYHYVDGISGSTLTGNGVTKFLKKDLLKYEPYFKKLNLDETE